MKLRDEEVTLLQFICLVVYYGFARYLPSSHTVWGKLIFSKKIRYVICKCLFKYIGKNVNIERLACFGSGLEIEIGDNSGLGINCWVPSNVYIGKNVMMGPNCYILACNHNFDNLDRPMIQQGYDKESYRTIIEDDVWIGRNVTMTPGRHILTGSVVGACCLLCKDFPSYSVIGGNPSRLIRSRIK